MSKKPQHNPKDNKQHKPPALDEENEPFLRVIHKKIRNINKRLTEITQLEQKDNLKPEQIEKINRKQHLIQERTKLEENIAFLKESYLENVELFKAHQLKELETLARTLAVYMTHPEFAEHAKLNRLWTGIQHIEGANLNEAITNISSVLKQAANDYKLQKALTSFVAQHGEKPVEKRVPTTFTHTDEIIIVKENVVNEQGGVDEIEIVEKIHDGKVEEVTILVNDQVKHPEPVTPPPTPTVPQAQQQQPEKQQPQTQQNNTVQGAKQAENIPQTKEERPTQSRRNNREVKYKGQLRERKEYRGERRGDGQRRYNDRGGEKRTYRPKQDRQPNAAKQEQERSASKSSQEEQARNFKKEQIKQLQDEGYTVVGKPKPKPQQTYHKQGRKNYRNEQNPKN